MRFSAATAAERFLPEGIAGRARPLAEQLDKLLSGSDARSEAGRMSLIAFALRIVNAFIALVSQVLLARYMGAFEYGIFVLVWVTMLILGSLSSLGIDTAIVRFIPEYRAKQRLAELRGVLIASRGLVLLFSTAFAIIGALGVYLFQSAIENYYIVPFYLSFICLPMLALNGQYSGVARANAWAFRAIGPAFTIRPMLILLFLWGMHFSGYRPDATAAVIAAILATYLTVLVQFVSIDRPSRREVRAVHPRFHLHKWIMVSLPIFLVDGFFYLLTNADVLMVGYFMEPSSVGIYYAAVKTLALVHFAYYAVKVGVAQRYAAYMHSGQTAELSHFARETVSWTFWPTLLMAGVVLLLGKPILSLFGSEFVQAYPLLFVLVAGVIVRAAIGPAETLLTMSGHQKICASLYGAVLFVNIGLNFILIPMLGLWGAALATALATIVEAVLISLAVWRKLGIAMAIFVTAAPRKEAT